MINIQGILFYTLMRIIHAIFMRKRKIHYFAFISRATERNILSLKGDIRWRIFSSQTCHFLLVILHQREEEEVLPAPTLADVFIQLREQKQG